MILLVTQLQYSYLVQLEKANFNLGTQHTQVRPDSYIKHVLATFYMCYLVLMLLISLNLQAIWSHPAVNQLPLSTDGGCFGIDSILSMVLVRCTGFHEFSY